MGLSLFSRKFFGFLFRRAIGDLFPPQFTREAADIFASGKAVA